MSSNLLKGIYTNVQQEDKRVIDTNELVAKRIEELSARMKQAVQNGGFVSGLNASVVEYEGDVEGEENPDSVYGNVIKGSGDIEELLTHAREEADAILEEARESARQIIEDAVAEAKQEKESVLSQARKQGYEEGKQQADVEMEQIRREYEGKEKELEEIYQKKIDELEPQFIDTITGIYEHIFHVELRSYRDVLVYLISATMRKIEGNREYIIHVSKDDYAYVGMQKKQIAAGASASNGSVEVVEDMTLSKNECLIETEGGIFDCGLGTQLGELKQKLKLLSYEKDSE